MEELGLGANNWDINKQFEVFTNVAKTKTANDINQICDSMVNAIKAFDVARKRSKKVASVDKANVLDSSRLWRSIIED